MNVKELLTEDRAVSPVIGVILMVAITVILAAVIGTFVLGLGESVQQQSPTASFSFDYETNGSDAWGNDATISVTHEGGDSIDADRLSINVGGTTINGTNSTHGWGDVTVGAGDTAVVTHAASGSSPTWNGGDDVRVVWTSQDGSSSQTIGSSTVPN